MRYVAGCGMVGSGFHESSFTRGIEAGPAFVGCDSGSTDAGPFQLGTGEGIFSIDACARDLSLMLDGARSIGVPLLIGSCGGAGTNIGVDSYAEVMRRLAAERGHRFRMARIYAEPDRAVLQQAYDDGKVHPLVGAPSISRRTFDDAAHVVAMMGAEPFQAALAGGADVVLAGRASDTSIYSAIPETAGFDPGLVWHAAKIMECGTGAVAARTGQDSMLCTMGDDHFVVEPLHPDFACTPVSVAAHTLYENGDPFRLVEPAGTLDTTGARYDDVNGRAVRVSGSRFEPAERYTLKLEAAELVGYQSIMMGSVRDPVILRQLDAWIESMTVRINERIAGSLGVEVDKDYVLNIRVYGRDGTLGAIEPTPVFEGHEAFMLLDVTADTQEVASSCTRLASHVAMHHPVSEWTGSITGVAHPYAPATIDRGPTYRFSLNHVIEVDDPLALYAIEYEEVGG